MTTDNDRVTKVEARLEAAAERARDRADQREAENNEFRESLALLTARAGHLESQLTRVETAVGVLQAVKPVSSLNIWLPAVVTTGLLATALGTYMSLSVKPEADKEERSHSANLVQDQRLRELEAMMHENRGQITELSKQIHDADIYGPRVKEKP